MKVSPKALAGSSLVLLLIGLTATLATDPGQRWPWFATIPLSASLIGFLGLLLWLLVRRLAKPDEGEFGLQWWLRHIGLVTLCSLLLMSSCLSCLGGTIFIMGSPPTDAQGRRMPRSNSSGYFFFGGIAASAAFLGLYVWVRRKADWS